MAILKTVSYLLSLQTSNSHVPVAVQSVFHRKSVMVDEILYMHEGSAYSVNLEMILHCTAVATRVLEVNPEMTLHRTAVAVETVVVASRTAPAVTVHELGSGNYAPNYSLLWVFPDVINNRYLHRYLQIDSR